MPASLVESLTLTCFLTGWVVFFVTLLPVKNIETVGQAGAAAVICAEVPALLLTFAFAPSVSTQ